MVLNTGNNNLTADCIHGMCEIVVTAMDEFDSLVKKICFAVN